jgi:hypothetical protein
MLFCHPATSFIIPNALSLLRVQSLLCHFTVLNHRVKMEDTSNPLSCFLYLACLVSYASPPSLTQVQEFKCSLLKNSPQSMKTPREARVTAQSHTVERQQLLRPGDLCAPLKDIACPTPEHEASANTLVPSTWLSNHEMNKSPLSSTELQGSWWELKARPNLNSSSYIQIVQTQLRLQTATNWP